MARKIVQPSEPFPLPSFRASIDALLENKSWSPNIAFLEGNEISSSVQILSQLGFNVKNLNRVVFASNIPYKQIPDLLKKWKVENLLALLLDLHCWTHV